MELKSRRGTLGVSETGVPATAVSTKAHASSALKTVSDMASATVKVAGKILLGVLAIQLPVFAAPSTIQLFDASIGHNVTVPLPIAGSGNTEYDIALAIHGRDGSATAGIDYLPIDVRQLLEAGDPGLFVPVRTLNLADGTPPRTFSLDVAATGIGRTATYSAPLTFPAQDYAYFVVLADINGDGRLDLVACSDQNTPALSVSLNQTLSPGGSPQFGQFQSLGSAYACLEPVIADINQDGMPDIVTSDYQAATLSVYLNSTSRGAAVVSMSHQAFALGTAAGGATAADFNRDGMPDIAINEIFNQHVSIFTNQTPRGSLTAVMSRQTFQVGDIPQSVVSGDFNLDGNADLAVRNANDRTIDILLNMTSPGSSSVSFAPAQPIADAANTSGLAVADMDGDGRVDLISGGYTFAAYRNATAPGSMQTLFEAYVDPALGDFHFFSTVDLTGDGKPDLIGASNSTTFAFVRNRTQRSDHRLTFDRFSYAAATPLLVSATAGDINGDDRLDLVGVDAVLHRLVVLPNAGPPSVPALTFKAPIAASIGQSFVSSSHADFNLDGNIDLVGVQSTPGRLVIALNSSPFGGSGAQFNISATADVPRARRVAAMDANSDGRSDVIAVGARGISFLLNDTAPGASDALFGPKQAFLADADVADLVEPDLDGDGRRDVVVLDRVQPAVRAALNLTVPGASSVALSATADVAAGSTASSIATGEVNGDGREDVVVVVPGNGSVSVYVNATAPGAAVPTLQTSQNFNGFGDASMVRIADINADGLGDIVVAGGSGILVAMNLTTRGAANLTFATPYLFFESNNTPSLWVGDLDGDGRPDVVTGGGFGTTYAAYLDRTSPGASQPNFYRAPLLGNAHAGTLDSFDVNRDGRPDIVASIGASQSLFSAINTQFDVTVHGNGIVTIVGDGLFASGFESPFH